MVICPSMISVKPNPRNNGMIRTKLMRMGGWGGVKLKFTMMPKSPTIMVDIEM